MSAPVLETERLRLRGWRENDLDPFAEMMADVEVARFLTADRRPLDRHAAWRSMAIFAGHWALKGYGLFVVEEKASGAFVGRVGPWEPEGWYGFEVGWGLMRRSWGKGYATEAAKAAGDWAFAAFDLPRVISVIHVDNRASQRVAQRLGMKAGSTMLHAGMPHAIWSVTREDWTAGASPA